MAKGLLTAKFTGHSFQKDGLTFTFIRPSKVKGEAQINIRKGKQIVVYEYELEVEFRAETQVDDCEGNFRVVEINESDLDFEVPSITITKEGKIGAKARQVLKQALKGEIAGLVKDLKEELMSHENDPDKLAQDRQKREENEAKLKQVIAEKGAEKERLLEELKASEAKLKQKPSNG